MFIKKYEPKNENKKFAVHAERRGGNVLASPSARADSVATKKRKMVKMPSVTDNGIPFIFSHNPNGIAIRAKTKHINGYESFMWRFTRSAVLS